MFLATCSSTYRGSFLSAVFIHGTVILYTITPVACACYLACDSTILALLDIRANYL